MKIISKRVGLNDHPTPASPSLAKEFYPTVESISIKILEIFNKKLLKNNINANVLIDKPDENFKGPF